MTTVSLLRRRFYTLLALRWSATGLVIPFLVLVMQERGLSLQEIGLALGVYGVTVIVLELPTGSFADSVGRRPTLLIAAGAMLLGEGSFLLAGGMNAFVAAWVLIGIGRALDSGALSAWFVDAALDVDPEVDLRRALAGAGAVGSGAIAVGALIGGALPALLTAAGLSGSAGGLLVPLVAALAVTLSYGVAIWFLVREPDRVGDDSIWHLVWRDTPAVLRAGSNMAVANRVVRSLLLAMAATGLAIGSLETLWQPRFAELFNGYRGNTFWFGALGAAAFLGAAVGSLMAPWVARHFRGSAAKGAMAAQVAIGATVVVLGMAGRVPLAAAAFTLAYVFLGIRNPLHEEMLHGQVSSAGRSTMLSLDSLALQLGGISGTVVAGLVAGAVGIPATWMIVGAVTALSGLLYLSVDTRKRARHPEPASAQVAVASTPAPPRRRERRVRR